MSVTENGCFGYTQIKNIVKDERGYLVNLARLDVRSINGTYINAIRQKILFEFIERKHIIKCGFQLFSTDIKKNPTLSDLASLNNENFCGLISDIHTKEVNKEQFIKGYLKPYGPKGYILESLFSSENNSINIATIAQLKSDFNSRNTNVGEIINLVGFSVVGTCLKVKKPKLGTFYISSREDEFV